MHENQHQLITLIKPGTTDAVTHVVLPSGVELERSEAQTLLSKVYASWWDEPANVLIGETWHPAPGVYFGDQLLSERRAGRQVSVQARCYNQHGLEETANLSSLGYGRAQAREWLKPLYQGATRTDQVTLYLIVLNDGGEIAYEKYLEQLDNEPEPTAKMLINGKVIDYSISVNRAAPEELALRQADHERDYPDEQEQPKQKTHSVLIEEDLSKCFGSQLVSMALLAPAHNGYLDTYLVLAKRTECPFPKAPYVIWTWCPGTGLGSGHYDMDAEKALSRFTRMVSEKAEPGVWG